MIIKFNVLHVLQQTALQTENAALKSQNSLLSQDKRQVGQDKQRLEKGKNALEVIKQQLEKKIQELQTVKKLKKRNRSRHKAQMSGRKYRRNQVRRALGILAAAVREILSRKKIFSAKRNLLFKTILTRCF